MDFQQSVRTCLQQKYATFDGRAGRAEYWWFVLFVFIGNIVANVLDYVLFGANMGVFSVIWSLGLLVPCIAVGVRRLHDLDKSGWWLLIGLIPLIGTIILIVWFIGKGTQGSNRFGSDPVPDGSAGA